MKTLNSLLIFIVLIAAFVYVMSFSGCSNSITSSGTAPKTHQARTEADFVKNPNLKAEPGAVIVVNLEDLHSLLIDSIPDTDLIGVDIIPYTYTETAEHTISIGDSSYFTVTLINEASKVVIYELTPASTHTTVTIPAGDYLMIITSLEEFSKDTLGSQIIFIQPDAQTALNRGGGNGQADYDPGQLNQFISTGSCQECDLRNISLPYTIFQGLDLTGADLSGAELVSVKVKGYGIFRNANLTGAQISYMDVRQADFRDASFNNARIYRCNFFNDANFTNAAMTDARIEWTTARYGMFDEANLTNATLINNNFENAGFVSAKLRNARIQNSIFYYGSFADADLTSANFSYSDFRHVNFCGSIKTNLISTGVSTDYATQCWP